MKKLKQVLAAIILLHFVSKTVRKLKHPDQVSKEEAYRAVRDVSDRQQQRPVAEVDERPILD